MGVLVPAEVPAGAGLVDLLAFVPSPLPSELHLSQATWSAVLHAATELGRLAGMTQAVDVPAPLVAGFTIRREAFSTSALEGTYAPVVDVLVNEATSSPQTAAITEVLNFIRAADHGARRLEELPVCVRLAQELHEILVAGTPSEDWQKGEVRQTHVVIGAGNAADPAERLAEARFVPSPPGKHLLDGLTQWESWWHTAPIHPLVRIAVSHYQFEVLHLFTDGNGRIGRLLAVLQLVESGILEAPVVNISPYFEVRRDRYIDLLEQVSAEGAWDEWITFFSEALAAQATEAMQHTEALLAWRDRALNKLHDAGVRGTAYQVVDGLISQPTVTASTVRERFGVSPSTAAHTLRRLVEAGVVVEVTERKYNRVYAATELLDLIYGRYFGFGRNAPQGDRG